MTIPPDAQHGLTVRWIGPVYQEPAGEVREGDQGTFIDFDGPGSPDVVVTFPSVGAFVCPAEHVEPAASRGG
jgi:hypothetical protein